MKTRRRFLLSRFGSLRVVLFIYGYRTDMTPRYLHIDSNEENISILVLQNVFQNRKKINE